MSRFITAYYDLSSWISTFTFRKRDNFMNVRVQAARNLRIQCQMHLMKNVKRPNLVGESRTDPAVAEQWELDSNSTAINVDLRDDNARVRIDLSAYSFRLMVVNDIPNYSRISKYSDKQLPYYARYNILRGFAETYFCLHLIKICNTLN